MLRLIPDDKNTKFRKRHVDVRNIEKINKHITDQRKQDMGKGEKPVTVADNPLDVLLDREGDIRNMLWKHEPMWLGQLAEINITEMRIDLVPHAKPFKSPPISARPENKVNLTNRNR